MSSSNDPTMLTYHNPNPTMTIPESSSAYEENKSEGKRGVEERLLNMGKEYEQKRRDRVLQEQLKRKQEED